MNIFKRLFGSKNPPTEKPVSKPKNPTVNYVDGGLADTLKKAALAGQHAKENKDTDITLEINGVEVNISKSTFDASLEMYAPTITDAKALVKKAASFNIGNPDRDALYPEIEKIIPKLAAAAEDVDAARAMVESDQVAAHYKLAALELKIEMTAIDLESEEESMREDDVDFEQEISEFIMPDGASPQYRIERTNRFRKSSFIDVFLISRDPYGPEHPSLYCWSFAKHERIDIPVERIGQIVEINSGNPVSIDDLPN